MDDLARQIEIRNRYRRREALRLTPEQRMQRMWALLEQYSAFLRQNPEAMDRFYRRNIHQRALRYEPPRTP